MIQTSIVGSSSSSGQMNEPSRGGGFTPNKDHPDYFDFFQTRQNCEDFNLYPPGTVRYVADVACAPPFIPSPYGEIGSIGATLAENDAAIKQIGPSTAVLLASGDHDTTAPPSNARADYDFYKANCGCDVTQLIIKDTAHLFMAHRSLASTIDYFVSWLRARGVAPPPPSGGAVSGPGGRRSPRGLTARVSPRRDRRAPFRFRISGRLLLFTGMDPAQVCGAGRVAVQTKAGHATVSNRRVRLRSDCTYRITLTLHLRSRLGSGRLRFIARFLGNDALRPARAKTRTARAGR